MVQVFDICYPGSYVKTYLLRVACLGLALVVPIASEGKSPTISSLSPTSGPVGTSVTINGSNFGSTQGSSTVTFNGTAGQTIYNAGQAFTQLIDSNTASSGVTFASSSASEPPQSKEKRQAGAGRKPALRNCGAKPLLHRSLQTG